MLVPQEVDELFGNLRELKAEGLTSSSSRTSSTRCCAVADEITVIRRGTTVATVDPGRSPRAQLAELMVGSELPSPGDDRESTVTDDRRCSTVDAPDAARRRRPPAARRHQLHHPPRRGARHRRRRGQRPGRARRGHHRHADAGRRAVLLGEQDITAWSTRRRREAGVGYIPEDRHRHGLLLEAPLWENRILGHQTRAARTCAGRLIDRRGGPRRHRAHRRASTTCARPAIDVAASALSGGNQQKLIVGREMSHAPKVLLAAHPTRGVDVGAQAAIWDQHPRGPRARAWRCC